MSEVLKSYFEKYPEKYDPIARLKARSNRIQEERNKQFEKRKRELECLTSIRQMVLQKI